MTAAALRSTGKRALAQAARFAPQARYGRMIFVLSHMRAASTALSNVLCSHPQIAGYGEAHVRYENASGPGGLLVNLARRGGLTLGAPYLFDKVLHNRLDGTVPDAFFAARAIFLARQPRPAIASIRKLAAQRQMFEYRTKDAAALYYLERMERLTEHWHSFEPDRRFGLTAEMLLAAPEARVARLGRWLGLSPTLENRYRAHCASQRGGGGDPTRSAGLNRIERVHAIPDLEPVADVSRELSALCVKSYIRFTQMIGELG